MPARRASPYTAGEPQIGTLYIVAWRRPRDTRAVGAVVVRRSVAISGIHVAKAVLAVTSG
jgi:hypothetical protein